MGKYSINLEFNKDVLKRIILQGEMKLKDTTISADDKEGIQQLITKLQVYIDILENKKINVQINDEIVPNERTFLTLGSKVLSKLKQDYRKIGPVLMDYIICLDEYRTIVDFNDKQYYCKQNIQEIFNDTNSVYEEFMPEFRKRSFEILTYPIPLVHVTRKNIFNSHCLYRPQLEMPFVFVQDINHDPTAFIHELQHAVEFSNDYNTNDYYIELGPILFETLYIDKIVGKKSSKAELLYLNRMEESSASIGELTNYFRALQEMSEYNFELSKTKMVDILEKYNVVSEEYLYDDLLNLLNYDPYELLNYLLSFLKSIELRTNFYDSKKIGQKELMRLLNNPKFDMNNLQFNTFIQYENYQKEIAEKVTKMKEKQILYKIKKLVK